MKIHGPNIWYVYWNLLSALAYGPKGVEPRGKPTREILGVQLRLDDALANVIVHPARDVNYRFMVAEWLWVLFGLDDVETIARFNQRMREFSDDGVRMTGAYGPRFAEQRDWLLRTIVEDPATRRAVISIWRPQPATTSKDVPCTLTMQILYRHDRLTGVVNMRSSDAWLGIPYDMFVFTMLLESLRVNLELLLRRKIPNDTHLILNLGSSHLYEEHRDTAVTLLQEESSGTFLRSPRLSGAPPVDVYQALHGTSTVPTQPLVGSWQTYYDVLMSPTRHNALEILRRGEPPYETHEG